MKQNIICLYKVELILYFPATPFRFTATLNTTLNKTQSIKKSAFDLQASLAKPLTWVPHKGKLKPFGEKTSPYKKPAIGQSIGKARYAKFRGPSV